jgi:hypothetical protein
MIRFALFLALVAFIFAEAPGIVRISACFGWNSSPAQWVSCISKIKH